MTISPLRVGNEEFLVSSLIERCPKSMMLRELVKNGLEAARGAPDGERRVEIGYLEIAGARKLTIWNTGPGMDADELYRMCDLASSIGKEQSLDENFGMGAKVASLPSNQYGIRYRSCKAARVHQVVMGKRDGVYGRVKQAGPDGAPADVVEVTAKAVANGRSLDADWTEVVLLGNRVDQDTLTDPYDSNPAVEWDWIARELGTRFYRLPAEIDLVLRPGAHFGHGQRRFVPIGNRLDAYARHEAVPASEGIVVHYVYDETDPEDPEKLLGSRDTVDRSRNYGYAAIVYRDEIYDVRDPWFWMREAPVYGVSFGARNFSIHIELPDAYPLVPDVYRQFLRRAGNLQNQLAALDFAPLAMNNRPAWLLDLLKNFSPQSHQIDGLRSEMSHLFKSLGVRRKWWPKKPTPVTPDEIAKAAEAAEAAKKAYHAGVVHYEAAPEIITLHDAKDVEQRGMNHNAARFYPETHQLFVNADYASFTALRAALEQEFADTDDPDAMRTAVKIAVEQTLIRQICRKLAFGLAKRTVWEPWQIDAALSSFSLTLAADDHDNNVGYARKLAIAGLKGTPLQH